ncbi:MAG: 5-formyltetrahydrofolate cyclo-ligase, partial [Quisquiliibacterium sp.]
MIDATDRLAARTALRAKRVALAAAQRAQADTQICDRLLELIDALAPSLMAVYWPMLGEPDLR